MDSDPLENGIVTTLDILDLACRKSKGILRYTVLALKFLMLDEDTSWEPLPSRAADSRIPYSGLTSPLPGSRETTEYFWPGGKYWNTKGLPDMISHKHIQKNLPLRLKLLLTCNEKSRDVILGVG